MFGRKKRGEGSSRRTVRKVRSSSRKAVRRVKSSPRKIVKRVKRSKSRQERLGKKSALSGAIKDLNLELKNLSRQKSDLKRSLGGANVSIDSDRRKEQQLQQQIARLIEKEARINKRKKGLQTKIDKVSDQMNKISKIRSEMGDI
jgi:chromosome segregation ATPase